MIYINGRFLPADAVKIEPSDRGFLLGDGLFETMRADKGFILGLEQHWQRLKNGLDYLAIPLKLTFKNLKTIIIELLQLNHLSDQSASLRLTISRGSGARGVLPADLSQPTVMLTASLLSLEPIQPAAVKIVSIIRNEFSPLTKIKSLCYLENIIARMQAVKAGATEAILLNTRGNVAEASAANIFIVSKENILITPRVVDGVLPGITRQLVIDLAEQLNIPIQERILTVTELLQAQEAFLTNSLITIQPIGQIDDIFLPLAENSITQQLIQGVRPDPCLY